MNKENKIEKKVRQLKALSQYKNKTDAEIREIAEKSFKKKEQEDLLEGDWLEGEEKIAKKLFAGYLKKYSVEKDLDLNLLKILVYSEIIEGRFQRQINEIQRKGNDKEANIAVPVNLIKSRNENLNQIINIKEKLGLFKEKKEDEYKAFQVLGKKFKIWKENHIEERKVTCPFCSEIFFLNIRTTGFTESKLKLFKNKVLCNSELWSCYKKAKITKTDFAKILNVSENYIDWLEEKIYNKKNEK